MVHTRLGIDPGLDGGLVFLTADGKITGAYRMPTYSLKNKAGKAKRYVCGTTLAKIIREHSTGLLEAWIEDVHSMPRDGHVGAFAFGEGKGVLKGVLAALGVPQRFVAPSSWKGAMGLSADKKVSIARAQGMFPAHSADMRHDGVAEAALLVVYATLRG